MLIIQSANEQRQLGGMLYVNEMMQVLGHFIYLYSDLPCSFVHHGRLIKYTK